eukprot:428289_1
MGVIQRYIRLWTHFVIILTILHFQDDMFFISQWYRTDNVYVAYQNISKWQIIYISSCALFCLYFHISTKFTGILRIVVVNGMFIIILAWSINLDFNLNSDAPFDVMLAIPGLTFCDSTIILFQWIIYDDALRHTKIFNANPNELKQTSSNKYIYFTIHIIYNIIVNVYSFIIIGIENLPFHRGHAYILHTLTELSFASIMLIPYYILPPLKYDLF